MSYTLQFLYMVMLTCFAAGKVTLQSKVCKKYIHGTRDSVFFNAMFFLSVLVFLVIIFHPTVYTVETLIFGALVGASTVMFQCCYSMALTCGPVSLTVMIGGFSIFISTVASVIMFDEPVSVCQIVGIILLIASLILTTYEKKHPGQKSVTLKWLVLSLLTLLTNGLGATLQKVYSQLYSSSDKGDTSISLLVVIYVVATILSFAVVAFMKKPEGQKFEVKHVFPYTLAMGIIISVYQRLYMYGLAHIAGIFFFPMSSGLSSLAMTLIGVLMFRDKLSKTQWIGTACGLACVCLMNIR